MEMKEYVMKKWVLLSVLPVVGMLSGCTFNDRAPEASSYLLAESFAQDFSEIADVVVKGVVAIDSVNEYEESVGSGVCINEKSMVITNAHVVVEKGTHTLTLSDGTKCKATLLYRDEIKDIAVLQAKTSIPYLKLATDEVKFGQSVFAIGTPLNLTLRHTLTSGVVSAMNRDIVVTSSSGNVTMKGLIQHDASINPGNSGGPLLNEKGEVIGINTLKILSYEGLGFAIPASQFQAVITKLLNK